MPSVSNLFKPGGLAWRPDSNAINAQDGALLRADNMVPDEDGALSVRRGTRELYHFPAGTEDIRALYTFVCSDGRTYRMMQADDQVYKNPGPGNHTAHWEVRIAEAAGFTCFTQQNYTGGNWEKEYAATGDVGPVPFTAVWEGPDGNDYTAGLISELEPVNFNVTFDGTGDIAFGDDHQQCFIARGTTKKKFDGKSFLNWGIAKPAAAATLAALTNTESAIMTCASGEADGIAGSAPIEPGGVVSYYPNALGGSDGATSLASASFVPDKGGTANQAIRISPGRSYGLTLGSLYKYFSASDPAVDGKDLSGNPEDIFSVDVYVEDPSNCEQISLAFFVTANESAWYIYTFNPSEGKIVASRSSTVDSANAYSEKVTTILDPIDPKDKPHVNTPEQVKSIINNVGDTNVPTQEPTSVPVGTWIRLSASRNQFQLVGSLPSGYGWETVKWVRLEFRNKTGQLGGIHFSDLALNAAADGGFTGTYKVVYRWVRETDRYYETSPPSDESTEISLTTNQLQVTIPAASQNGADDQATDVWVYVFGGFLDTYYRAAVATADPQLNSTLVVELSTNEVAILTENERLEPYVDVPRDNIIGIAGPWNGRLFTLTSEGYVYPSLQTSPSTFNTYQVLDLSNQGDPLWMVRTSSGITVGSEKDVIRLDGTGDEEADRVIIDLYAAPLNLGTPPFDRSVFVDGNSILYRSTDGLIMLTSQGLTHVPDDGVRLLWRGQDRHGVSALNVQTGRFRMTVDGKIMYVLVCEGATTEGSSVVYRLDLGKGQWSRCLYPDPLLSIWNEPDGTTIAGTNNGKLLELDYGTGDESVNPSVTILTPFSDGGNPLARKDAFDLQFHADTNGNTATVNVYKDGSASSASSYTFSTTQPQPYRIQAEDVGSFIRAQIQVTGTFDEFQLSMLDMTFRGRPQHMNYLDTGYVIADDPADVVWLQEVEIDANSPSDLWVQVYLDDRQYCSELVSVTANVRSVYRVPLPRGCKARRPRIVVKTSAADGAGEVGFDPYFVRVRTRNSGNQSGNRFRTIWPAGEAP